MEDLIGKFVGGKLVLPALLVVGGVIFVVKRLILSVVEKNAALRWIARIKRNPSDARLLADTLDIPYRLRDGFSTQFFEELTGYIAGQERIASYQVLFTMRLSQLELLVFTLIAFDDFDVGITGTGTDVKKQSYVPFLLAHDPKEMRLTIYSDSYTTSSEKFHRDGFLAALFEGTMG